MSARAGLSHCRFLRAASWGVLATFLASPLAIAAENGEGAPEWKEVEVALPAMPEAKSLIEVYVSAASTNHFFVDPASLSVGEDGVVRYVVSVKSPSGASSVNFEGMRCDSRERRLYAFGRGDNTWSRARNSAWTRISNAGANRYPYVLMREYFCPGGVAIRNAAEGLDALKRGGHPAAQSSPGS